MRVSPLRLGKVRTYSLTRRKSKVTIGEFAQTVHRGMTVAEFLDHLPDLLASKNLRALIDAMRTALKNKRLVVMGLGAHPIKVGLSPILIDLMERGMISSLALNGAGIIHDCEIALVGHTSEDVEKELINGSFGMAKETATILNESVRRGVKRGMGIGESVGKRLLSKEFPFRHLSLLATGVRLGIPVTVHVALGTDIIHMHPSASGAAIGEGTMIDFRKFASVVSRLEKGVYLNIGSAVILPEVFLKALTLARNLWYTVRNFVTADFDFIHHYRPSTNVVHRPTKPAGRGYSFIGHHEIMIPLLAAGLIEGQGYG